MTRAPTARVYSSRRQAITPDARRQRTPLATERWRRGHRIVAEAVVGIVDAL